MEIIAHNQIKILFIHPHDKEDKMRTLHQGDWMNYVEEKNRSHDFNSMDASSTVANQYDKGHSFEYPQGYP